MRESESRKETREAQRTRRRSSERRGGGGVFARARISVVFCSNNRGIPKIIKHEIF